MFLDDYKNGVKYIPKIDKRKKKIYQIDIKTGSVVSVYERAACAAKAVKEKLITNAIIVSFNKCFIVYSSMKNLLL